MSLIKCYECQKEISTAASVCPNCGAKAKKDNGGYLSLFATFAILVAGVVWFENMKNQTPEGKEKLKLENAAETCWKGYERKSLTDDDKRAIAKFCEQIESEAKAKSGDLN